VARHSHVFSKIQALRLQYQKLVFLDLDLVPRADLSSLFDVQAPAGMHHGDRRSGKPLQHGQPIAPECNGWWCVNAGVLRLDPGPTRQARRQNVASLVDDVRRIRWPTALPEQYFLADRMEGWRHLDPQWNMEVGPHYDDPGFTWPRTHARQAAAVPRSQLWLGQTVEDVRVFHFSGTKLHPWWYVDLSPQAAFDEAAAQWYHRDPRRLIATAIFEWRLALDATMTAAASWPVEAQQPVYAAMSRLREDANAHRSWAVRWSTRPSECYRCRNWFPSTEGRWLLGWEGWWLCSDCIVGYIFSDEEASPPQCWACGGMGSGSWEWIDGKPWWNCSTCGPLPRPPPLQQH